MRLAYSLCGVGLASAYGYANAQRGEVVSFAQAERNARALQQSDQLCSTSGQSTPEAIWPYCKMQLQEFEKQNWQPCCAFEGTDSDMCREFTTSGKYCDLSTDPDGCALDNGDKIEINIKFSQVSEDERCCHSCTCYGDPECVSFENVADLWIPCDARRSSDCRTTEAICGSLTDPNGDSCQWLSSKSTNAGWDIALNGSPCVPKSIADGNGPAISMSMYRSSGNKFTLDLELGERGIIMNTIFRIKSISNKDLKLNAQTCFDEEGIDAWTNLDSLPSGWSYERSADNKQVLWLIFDEATNTKLTMACVRHIEGNTPGAPRINVEDLSVKTVDNGADGFCKTGVIADKTGTWQQSEALHAECVQDVPTALQACKHLVSMGLAANALESCAQTYCSLAALSDSDKNQCLNKMGNGENVKQWKTWYCKALKNNEKITNTKQCGKDIDKQGFNWAVESYGKGYVEDSGIKGCNNDLSAYSVDKKESCVDGVYIDLYDEVGQTWVETYFIPANFPPCNDLLTILPSDNKDMFTHTIRMRQCDIRAEATCGAARSCSSTVGAEFWLTITNTPRTLTYLYEKEMLCCSPNEEGSTTWCLPGSDDYEQVTQVCPCDESRGDGRRLLDILLEKSSLPAQ